MKQCLELAKQGKLAEAEPFCAKGAEESKEGRSLYGEVLALKGDGNGAVEQFSLVLKGADLDKPTDTEYHALRKRAIVQYQMGGSMADFDADRLLKLQPKDPELLTWGALHSQFPKSRVEYARKLVELEPQSARSHVVLSMALSAAGKGDEAIAAADAALKLDSKSQEALTARARACAAAGNHARAEKEFAALARKAPGDMELRVSRAEALVQLGRHDDAVEETTAVLQQQPQHGGALFVRAHAHLAMGRADAALADFRSARAAGVNVPHSVENTAQHVNRIQQAITPESVAQLELDRAIIVRDVKAYMHRTCGYFNVDTTPDNDALDRYRKCLTGWYQSEDYEAVQKAVGAEAMAAGDRFYDTVKWLNDAEKLLCSKMPKKATCIPDALHARAAAALDIYDDARVAVGDMEFDRLNREIDAWNARENRRQALYKTASFLDAVAKALSQQ